MAQMVKNLPEMRETWVGSLGWEDPLEEGMATYSSILAWRIPWTEKPRGLTVYGVAKSWTQCTHIYMYPFFSKLLSHPGCCIKLNRVPCAMQ